MIYLWLHLYLIIKINTDYVSSICLQFQYFSEQSQNRIFVSQIFQSYPFLIFSCLFDHFLSFWSLKSLISHQYLIKTIFQAAHQDPDRGEGSWNSSLIVNFHLKKFNLPHNATVRLFGRRIDSSSEQGCKEREEICQRIGQRGQGGNSFIYYSWSVIWIFTIANPGAIHSRDDVTTWVWHSVAQGIHICSRPPTPYISVGHKSRGRDCRL